MVFAMLLYIGGDFFTYNIRKLIHSIHLGRLEIATDHKRKRLKSILCIALGQQKILVCPIVAVLHLIVYAGFSAINTRLLEIIINGLTGSHRMFTSLGTWYYFLIITSEELALLAIIAIITFWMRCNILKVPRSQKTGLKR